MDPTWTSDQLTAIDRSAELEIATLRGDGTWARWLPIWAVCAEGRVFVRTWRRRDSGWYGRALHNGRGRIRVPGLELDVAIEDVGTQRRAAVDAAYRAKYGGDGGAGRMVGDEAAATTLALTPARSA